jgi:vancomycin resistance protein YoaR
MALGFALLGLLGVLSVGFVSYQVHYSDRIHRGVRVWHLDLGGLNRVEAQTVLADYFASLQSAWVLRDGQQTWTAEPATLGISLDAGATAEAAFAVGRSGSTAWNWGEQLRVAANGIQVAPVILYDEAAARRYLEQLAQDIYRPVQDAELNWRGLEIFETRAQVGRQLNVEATLAALRQTAGQLDRREVSLVVKETFPRVIDAAIAHDQAQLITSQPITLYIESELYTQVVSGTAETIPGPWTLSRENLAAMLVLKETPVGDDGSVRLDVALDQGALGAFLAPISQVISRTASNARFIFNDDTRQLEVIVPSSDGLALDVEATLARINTQALGTERRVALAAQVVPAEFNENTTAEELGVTELVVSHVSYFAGSSEGRRNNIQVAARKFHGIVIKPGQVFSFNEWLGEVTKEEGYDESLIIFGNETIPDVGGGICQVSSTAFGAAFWGGFPVVERWAHAYRVGYYEQGNRPVGMDATIYSPLVDLKFVNDTPYHLLIETYVNQNTSALQFKFYSTGVGRVIELEGPVVSDVIEHGEAVYKEDAELAPGEIKQIEWATNGLTAVITRTVRSATSGDVIERKEFKSKFRPWNAVYLVGPGTEVPGHDVIRLDEQDTEG